MGRRRRRRANIKWTLAQRLVFQGQDTVCITNYGS